MTRTDKKFISRLYVLWVIFWWLSFYASNSLLHTTSNTYFVPVDVDPTIIVLNNFGVIKLLLQNLFVLYTIDYVIIISAVILLFFPFRSSLFFILLVSLSLFDLCYSAITFHHSHGLYAILIIALPLCFIEKEKEFPFLWLAARYIPIFTYIIAFYWKVRGGAYLHPMQGVAVVKANLAGLLAGQGDTIYARFIAFFLRHPKLLNNMFIAGFTVEGVFSIALFTKKYDFALIIAAIILHISIVYFVDAYFTFHLILLLPMLPLYRFRNSTFYKLLSI